MQDQQFRIAVRLEPRVFGDALALALRDRGLDAVVWPLPERRRAPRAPQHFAVAVVDRDLPEELVADNLVVLGPEGRLVRVIRRGHEEEPGWSGDLLDLVQLVRDLAIG